MTADADPGRPSSAGPIDASVSRRGLIEAPVHVVERASSKAKIGAATIQTVAVNVINQRSRACIEHNAMKIERNFAATWGAGRAECIPVFSPNLLDGPRYPPMSQNVISVALVDQGTAAAGQRHLDHAASAGVSRMTARRASIVRQFGDQSSLSRLRSVFVCRPARRARAALLRLWRAANNRTSPRKSASMAKQKHIFMVPSTTTAQPPPFLCRSVAGGTR